MTAKRKTYDQLLHENRALRLALEDTLDFFDHPDRYFYRLIYDPNTRPANESNPPGIRGLEAMYRRAKSILGRVKG